MQLFAHKKLKKTPSKVAHYRPKPFFPQPSPTHSQKPKIDLSYHKNVPPSVCFLVCDDDLVPALPAGFVTNLISPQASRLYKVLQSTEVAIFMLRVSFYMFCSVRLHVLFKNSCFARRPKDLDVDWY